MPDLLAGLGQTFTQTVIDGPLLAVALHKGMGRLAWVRDHQQTIVRIGGIVLTILGVLLVTGIWTAWIYSLQGLISGFEMVI